MPRLGPQAKHQDVLSFLPELSRRLAPLIALPMWFTHIQEGFIQLILLTYSYLKQSYIKQSHVYVDLLKDTQHLHPRLTSLTSPTIILYVATLHLTIG